jgi:xanthine/uracil permease
MWKALWVKVKALILGIWKVVSDPFQDKNGDWDEKRLLGTAFLVVGLLYAIGRFGVPDSGILTIILGTGVGLLGGAIVGDVNNPKSGS